ncbi:MAG TPA: FAD-binding oxidoreductase [Solirubrobacterales bacterium]|nr:FAD-binding oxidoreductase [Solirubrobacterales bacterium]
MTSATEDSLSDIPSTEEELGCYSALYSTRAPVRAPADVEQLRRIFTYAREAGRRVTLRAGAHSFDGQALGDDLVVSMLRLDSIEVLADERKVRVGPGATWGAILAKLEPLGLVPAVTVTTENATAGGTLSGDCLSRFSPAWGKEGEWVESFDLLTTEGELLHCTAPDKGAPRSQWTREQRVFCGVIGGLGYLGAVVAITYRLLSVGSTDGQIGVRTIVRKFETFADLASDLVPKAEEMLRQDSDPRDPEKLDAIWSALDTRGKGTQSALFFTSTFTTTPDRRRMPLHRPELAMRVVVEWLMRVPFISRLLWRIYFRFLFRDGEEYIDDLEGFSFFMDGNARAKRIAKHFGFTMRNVQQTFVVPSDPGAEGGWDRAKDDLVEWLEYAHNFLLERKLTPTLNDALFLPKDLPFDLSASADLPGFAVSYAFETSNRATIERVKEAFIELADVLWDKFHGRVYLVKNVFAKKTTLAAMYGDHAVEFFRLKRELDPAESCETTSSSARSAIWSSASTRTTNRVGRRP